MARKKRGKAAKNARAASVAHEDGLEKLPHSFVFHRGIVGKHIKELVRDARKVMEPYTASRLQVKKSNSLRDLTSVAGVLHVSHFMMFTQTEMAPYLRIMRTPQGPTLTFKIHNYCLSRDVVSSSKHPNVEQSAFLNHPLLVMNNLSGEQLELKLLSSMFQNMFPSINVNQVNLSLIRRCVLVNYDKESKLLDLRHYLIKVAPVGISKSIKKLIRPKLPNLSRFTDIKEFIEKGGNLSESEGEMDGPHNEVILPQEVRGRGNVEATQSAIRLREVGPRLTLQLVKIEDGLCDGTVLFHEFVHKSLEEKESLRALRERKRKIKERQKREQLENVRRKMKLKELQKQKSLEGMKKKVQANQPETQQSDKESENDEEYFKTEVGQAPDEDLFPKFQQTKKKKLQNKTDHSDKQNHSSSNGPSQKRFKRKRPNHSRSSDPPQKKFKGDIHNRFNSEGPLKKKFRENRQSHSSSEGPLKKKFRENRQSHSSSKGPPLKKFKFAGSKADKSKLRGRKVGNKNANNRNIKENRFMNRSQASKRVGLARPKKK